MRLMVIAALMIGGVVVEAEANSRQDEVAALRELASREVVRNAKVVVRFGPQGAWDAAWVGVDAGVFNAGFSVSVDSKVLRCKGESPAATFKDALGRGQVVREEINDGVRAIREVKVYDSGVIAIAGEIRNEAQEDVVLKAVRMVDGSSAGSGWSFGDNQSSPGVVKVTGISTLECEAPSLAPG